MNKIITLTEMCAEWSQLVNRDSATHQLTEAGYTIVQDELGRPGLSLADAKLWLEAQRRATIAAEAREVAFAQHQADTRAWVKGREDAAWAANRRARDASGGSTGAAMGAGQLAGTRAAEEYERTVPRLLFDGRAGTQLFYIEQDEAPERSSPLDRVKSTARRAVGLEASVR